jgi:CO/xanthine dehydrogenase Mo-binding subunit
MEGGIVYGLSAATRGEITLKDGAVEQSSFHDYPIMSMHEIPPIDIKILTSGDSPTGVGETSLPPIAPAVANALFHATQQRIRRLPFSRAGFSQWRAGPDFS